MLAVGIGGGVSQKELRAIASEPVSQNVINVTSFDTFNTILTSLTEGICDSKTHIGSLHRCLLLSAYQVS